MEAEDDFVREALEIFYSGKHPTRLRKIDALTKLYRRHFNNNPLKE